MPVFDLVAFDLHGTLLGRPVAWVDRGGEPPSTRPRFRVTSLSEVLGLVH
jgi:hypothetical protein